MRKNNLIKKGLVLAVILLFVSVSVIPSTGTTVEKKSSMSTYSGNTLYVGGSGEGNYSNIQSAIDNASDGDTVFVYSGTYYERVKLNKAIDLIGENKVTTVIDAGGNGDAVKITANGVTIEGFTFQNSGNNYQYPDVGVEVRSDNNILSGNIIRDNLIGIWLYDASRNTIHENTITHNDMDGIFINEYTYDNVVSGNIISNNGYEGISLVGFMNNYRHNISYNTTWSYSGRVI